MVTMNRQGNRFGLQSRPAVRGILHAATICAALAAQPSVLPVSAQSTSFPTNAVLTDKDAYLLLPPELISGPVVERSTLSPASQNVAVLRKITRVSAENFPSAAQPNPSMPRIEQELIFWNAASRKPVLLWESARPLTQVTLSEWMPGTASLFATIDEVTPPDGQQPGASPSHDWKLLLLGRGIERAHIVPIPTGKFEYISIDVSPLRPLAILEIFPTSSDQQRVFYLIHQNGRVGARIDLPAGSHSGPMWDATGSPVVVVNQKDSAANRPTLTYYSVDLGTGQTRLLPKRPPGHEFRAPAPPVLPFHIVSQRQNLAQAESKEPIRPVWLEGLVKSEGPRAVLTADGKDVSLLPDADGAVFNSQNALWFTPIVKIDKVQYLAMRRAAERITAISNGKQLALAALMYSQDYDEVLPGPEGIQDKLFPYLKNDGMFEGFTYTFAGGSLADIESPAETILGHVDGPGGRAVMYVDGHVKWINN